MNPPKRPNRSTRIILILLALVLLALLLWWVLGHRKTVDALPVQTSGTGTALSTESSATTAAVDTGVVVPDTVDTVRQSPTPVIVKKRRAPTKPVVDSAVADTVAADTVDTTGNGAGSLRDTDPNAADAEVTGPCSRDTVAPWVYPDPSGGLHRGKITLRFVVNKPCTIEWRKSGGEPWTTYDGSVIPVSSNMSVLFRAVDSCGNKMQERREDYEITSEQSAAYCPVDMEYVDVSGTKFCIDRYEWPNKRGIVPSAYVSLYQATDSCFAAGKRLCSTEEWIVACKGSYGWAYPYGDRYEPNACVTRNTGPRPSGAQRECRSYFGIYDMSGNLAEWTSTRSAKNREFYNVMGGFWESGASSGCADVRYSYFPQNRHNPVGFRCCQDASAARLDTPREAPRRAGSRAVRGSE